ncbi:MAG: hypothetical protein P8M11_07030 [Planctomycetota bacterium]|nr:hypothetical protein [Planctomycetota bacterium]MDG1984301.1 hypothetical protein [Planctomycetota bacterium]
MTFNQQKSHRYAFVHERYNKALSAGFYLEAITICESLISDRLLSSLHHREKVERNPKKGLAELIGKHKKQPLLDPVAMANGERVMDIFSELDRWRRERNALLHGIAKCVPGTKLAPAASLMERSKKAAEEGMHLFRMLDSWHRRAVTATRQDAAAGPLPAA